MSSNTEVSFNGAANSDSFIILMAVVLAFLLIGLWYDAITGIYYDLFEVNRNDPLNAFVLAVFMSIIVIVIFYCIHSSCKNN